MFTIIITLKIAISMVNMSVKISNVECEENEDCTKACPDEEGRCIPHCVISPTGGKCTYGNLIIANLDEILKVEEDNRKDTDKEDQSEENNGRLDFIALRDHYEGIGANSKESIFADKILKTLFYSG